MTTPNNPLCGAETTPPAPLGTTSNDKDTDSKVIQTFADVAAIAAADMDDNEKTKKLVPLLEDIRRELVSIRKEYEYMAANVPPCKNTRVVIFVWGFTAGILSCLAVGIAYHFLRRVTVKTRG